MEESLRREIKALIEREVVVATGCTEPGAVALAVTKAREMLGTMPQRTELLLSKNVFKNAMGVGIPGTGMVGLPIAVAMALVSGDSTQLLEVLTQTPDQVEHAKQWLANNGDSLKIGIKENCDDKLYIECRLASAADSATAIIAKRHTNFVYLSHGDEVIFNSTSDDYQVELQSTS